MITYLQKNSWQRRKKVVNWSGYHKEMILLKKQLEKLWKKSKNLLTILSECGKVNKLSTRERIAWKNIEKVWKNLKKVLDKQKKMW